MKRINLLASGWGEGRLRKSIDFLAFGKTVFLSYEKLAFKVKKLDNINMATSLKLSGVNHSSVKRRGKKLSNGKSKLQKDFHSVLLI